MGAPVGNQNGVKNRPFAEAINRALLAKNGQLLRKIADRLVHHAAHSKQIDITAIREVLDRTDGKPRQQVEHTGLDDGPIAIEFTQRERARRVAFLLAANDPEHAEMAEVPKRGNGA